MESHKFFFFVAQVMFWIFFIDPLGGRQVGIAIHTGVCTPIPLRNQQIPMQHMVSDFYQASKLPQGCYKNHQPSDVTISVFP